MFIFPPARATRLNFEERQVACEEYYLKERFEVNYEYLILAVGSTTNTFNVPGVCPDNHVYFLKQLRWGTRVIEGMYFTCNQGR